MNYLTLVRDPSFFSFLLQLDLTIVDTTRKAGCPGCSGTLDRSDWKRKGYGIPAGCPDEIRIRHSFQCRDCNQRTTPNSLRWTYYRWYSACLKLLVSALTARDCKDSVKELCETFQVSTDLIQKWRSWWRETFQSSPFWAQHLSRFGFTDPNVIPDSLLAWYEHHSKHQGTGKHFTSLLEFLSRYRTLGRWKRVKKAIEKLWMDDAYHLCLV